MNMINKYLSLAIVASLGAALASCDNSKNNDSVSYYDGTPGVYFSNTENAYLELDEEKNTITYYVYRDVAGEEQTVPVSVEPQGNYDGGIYTFPSAVTFPAGSKVGDFVIGYDISKTKLGEEQQFLLTLDAEPNPFSSNTVVITLINPAPWELLGTDGKYYDYGWGVDPDYNVGPVTVSIYQQGVDKSIFRISNPYIALNEDTNEYMQLRLLEEGSTYLGMNITLPDLVAFDPTYIEYSSDDGSDIYLYYPAYFQDLNVMGYVRNSRVVEYQDNGLPGMIQLAPLYFLPSTSEVYGDATTPYVEIYFPGYVSYDASIEIGYEGTLIAEDQSQYVLLTGTIGTDVSEARVAVSADLSGDDLIAAIEDGSVEYTSFNSSGSWRVPFDDMPTGQYNVAAIAYVGEDAKSVATASFFYVAPTSDYNPNEGWTSLGYLEYTDGYVVATLFTGTDKITYDVEIQENNETPGLYRLVNPYGTLIASFFGNNALGKDTPASYLLIDARDKTHVKILQSEQTLQFFPGTRDQFEFIYAWCWADMWESQGATQEEIESQEDVYGTFADGQITFPAYALNMVWSDEPDEVYSGNYALDYEKYQAGDRNPIYTDEKGNPIAPFCVDFNTLTQDAPQTQAMPVGFTRSTSLFKASAQLRQQNTKMPMPDKFKKKNRPELKKMSRPVKKVK